MDMTRTTLLPKLAAVVAAGTMLLAACGDDDTDTASSDVPAATTAEAPGTAAPATAAPTTAGALGDIYATPDTTAAAAPDTTAAGGGDATEAPLITTATTDLGEILIGEDGFTVYGFTPDAGGTPTCTGGCASNWPPVTVESAELPAGLDPDVFSVVEYPEGGFVLRAGEWPLYYYAGDPGPGMTNGQGVSDVWYVVDPTGNLIGA
jgi:predicted lipoprotein with Yx(FWY)xxD motif